MKGDEIGPGGWHSTSAAHHSALNGALIYSKSEIQAHLG